MLITGVITACSCNTLKPEGFPPRGKREEQDLSSSLLLHLAKRAEPQSEAVSAKWGAMALHQAVTLPTLFCSGLLVKLIFSFEPFVGFAVGIFLNKCTNVRGTVIGFMANHKERKFATCSIPL